MTAGSRHHGIHDSGRRLRPFLPGLILLAASTLPALGVNGLGGGLGAGLNVPEAREEGRVDAALLADRTAIVPGEKAWLAIPLRIEKEWHVYWRNSGDTGLPTDVSWTLPKGFKVGPVLMPPPVRYRDALSLISFVLDGEPVLLAELEVPPDAPAGESVTIEAMAEWLVCKELCIMGDATLKLSLPVVAEASRSKPDNSELFKAAHARIPSPIGEAPHLSGLRAGADVDAVRPGDAFRIAVAFEPLEGTGLVPHERAGEKRRPLDVFPDAIDGLTIEHPEFPSKMRPAGGKGEAGLLDGRAVVVLPVTAAGDIVGETIRLTGVATYQVCPLDDGDCESPAAVEWEVVLPLAEPGAKVSPANAELFQGGIAAKTKQEREQSLAWILLLAFIAGIILNVMPCVLPVISIKVLSFVQQAAESPARVFKLGLAFAAGIQVAFNILAILATGIGLAWGQHFQSSAFTVTMTAIIFAFALSLFGVFTLSVPRAVGQAAGKAEEGEGYIGSVAKGLLATAMGTPCLGPFMGTVLLWVANEPPGIVFLVFNVMGLGMALPYVLLTANPRWLKFVPRPGAWMETFKEAMGFLLMLTVLYLLFIVETQFEAFGLLRTVAFLTGVAIACWIVGKWVHANQSLSRKLATAVIALSVIGASGFLAYRDYGSTLEWEPYSRARLNELLASDRMVLLDITASWCPNCHYNSAFVFGSREVVEAVRRYNAVPVLADWSGRGEDIRRLIDSLAPGASIPLCAVFPAGKPDEAIVLLGTLTKQQVLDAMKQAAGAS